MKKFLILLLIPFLGISQTQTENFIKQSKYLTPTPGSYANVAQTGISTLVYVCPTGGGGGSSGSYNITDDYLNINFAGSWSPSCRLNIGPIITINSNPALPDMELGVVTQTGGIPTDYKAKIKNGQLYIYSPYSLTGVNTSLSVPYVSSINYPSTSIGSIYECPVSGAGGGSGTISIANNTVTLSFSGGWSDTCNIKTGVIKDLVFSPAATIVSLDLGPIKSNSGEETAYRAKIENNKLIFYSPVTPPTPITSVNSQFSVYIGPANAQKSEQVSYYDGLGRLKQLISGKSGGQGQDLVTPIQYDGFGRQNIDYLPFPDTATHLNLRNQSTLIASQKNFYVQNFSDNLNPFDPVTFKRINFEASPLNRILETSSPGEAWRMDVSSDSDHTVKQVYSSNSATAVRKYLVAYDANNNPVLTANGYYASNQLTVDIKKDENWQPADGILGISEEYKDKSGKLILRRSYDSVGGTPTEHNTYYVYNDMGLLVYVMPPLFNSSVESINIQDVSKLCYIYKYDTRGRIIEKKIPGKEYEYLVYDKFSRLALTQDKLLRDQGKWLFTRYDAFGRIAYSGIFSNNSSRAALQSTLDGWSTPNVNSTSAAGFSLNGLSVFYSSDSNFSTATYPTSNTEILAVYYYDNYRFMSSSQLPSSVYGEPVVTNAKSLLTATLTRVLDTNKWLVNYQCYDNKGRTIYSYSSDAYLNFNAALSYKLEEMTGYILEKQSLIAQQVVINGVPTTNSLQYTDYYTYDAMGRQVKHTQRSGNNPDVELIAFNKYDALGRLAEKKVGGVSNPIDNYDSCSGLQMASYSYNIRGWLRAINIPDSNPGAWYNPLFNFEINYDNAATPAYNGNISRIRAKTPNDQGSMGRSYDFTYDKLNRLTNARSFYHARTKVATQYGESISYDKNGNILNLTRGGWQANGTMSPTLDQLTYSYDGNRLINVVDTGNAGESFVDGNNPFASGANDYAFDDNGNMVKDLNKGIGTVISQGIEYNHLNLPKKINFPNGIIEYIYDASGKKLEKRVTETINGNTTLTVKQYFANCVYQKLPSDSFAQLQFVGHDEGYATKNAQGSLDYVYHYKDHLGNVRLSYKAAKQLSSADTFDFNSGGFTAKGGANTVLQGGTLVVMATNDYAGASKLIASNALPGKRYHFDLAVDRGSTESVRVFVTEANPTDGSWTEYLVGILAPGQQTFSFDYMVKEQPLIHLQMDKINAGSTPSSTIFRLLDLKVYNVATGVVEENSYYPFGLTHKGFAYTTALGNASAQKYKYNGKELQDELALNMYDYGARNYDPATGRWINIDPKAEEYRRWSPYNYCVDNPVKFIDPDGMGVFDVIITGKEKDKALNQLKQSSPNLDISVKKGKVVATAREGATLTEADKTLMAATTNPDVVVKIDATNKNIINNTIVVGGVFDGNTFKDGKVTASQIINPNQAEIIDRVAKRENGVTTLHEILESYLGGLASLESESSAPSNMDVEDSEEYRNAHKAAEDTDNRHKNNYSTKILGNTFYIVPQEGMMEELFKL